MIDDPLALLITPGPEGTPSAVASRAARALLDLPALSPPPTVPAWLAAHQRPAFVRLTALLERHGGAVLADAPGLGKSYVALAVALERREPFTLTVPAVLVGQWRQLCQRFDADPEIITHEFLSRHAAQSRRQHRRPLLIVDEAHHFRNPASRRYRNLATLAIGSRMLLVTATPVHNRIADLVHLLKLFLRDDALVGLGVPSLKRAAAGEAWAALPAALAHLVVARSRARAPALGLPERARGKVIRVGPAPNERLLAMVEGVSEYRPGPAGALVRMVLLTRLASSLPAFRESLSRQEAFADFSAQARESGRAMTRQDFQRLFPRGEEPDIQLALLPLLLPPSEDTGAPADRASLTRLREASIGAPDPKVARLDHLLRQSPAKTIVFTSSRATARYLLRTLRLRHRVAVVMGARGLLPTGSAPVGEILGAFAPVAWGLAPPPTALAIDVLIATDLASEGLNLQDASRVIHYDLPWTAARLAQRVGRIDRLGSPHARIGVVTFLPPAPLAECIRIEDRLLLKARVGRRAGLFDWCDRLQALTEEEGPGAVCSVRGEEGAVLLVLAVGGIAEVMLVRATGVTADPRTACQVLETAAVAPPLPCDSGALQAAICRAAPMIRKRLDQVAAARWRAGDRDQLSRRLIPMVVAEARRAARNGEGARVGRLDRLVARLGSGLTAGEERLLWQLLEEPSPVTAERLAEWSERLPPAAGSPYDAPEIHLVAAIVVHPTGPG